jgi:hypothetical protein
MKKALLLGLVVGAMAAMSALADQIKVEPGHGPYDNHPGGEFTILPIGFHISGYLPGTTGDIVEPGTFQTFCLELGEGIHDNAKFDVIHSTKTVYAGITLNKGTAWLYQQFATGTWASYDYGAGRHVSGIALQNEIWFLMSQVGTPDATFDPIVNAAALGGGWNVLDPNDGQFPVEVLNVWFPGLVGTVQGAHQDILVIPGTPDGGLTLALLGMGLSGLGVVSRRIRK